MQTEKTKAIASAKAGMDEKTARKYIKSGKLPSDLKKVRYWRTRKDSFAEVWEEVRGNLETNPGFEAKTLFDDLQDRMPGRFSDGQLRSFQRRVKYWRAVDGPGKEIFFPQAHHSGELAESDFTSMQELGISIGGCRFDHLLYHFVLTYSNWETGRICYSESFESLSTGLQDALWELGGVPQVHQTDRLTAAVHNSLHPEEFTQRYQGLLRHYGLAGRKTQPASPHENGDIEQRNYRFKRALKQALLLRGSADFSDLEEYKGFLKGFFVKLNQGRRERFLEEQRVLRSLPEERMESCKRLSFRVGPSSTIRISHNVYSVESRLIGEQIQARVYAEHIEIYYGQKYVDTLPRLRGENRCLINYRHIIDQLERKPGAFENYRYREELFPGSHFRLAYDELKERHTLRQAVREYLKILQLAAKENETLVGMALASLYGREPITSGAVEEIIQSSNPIAAVAEVGIVPVDLAVYDQLLFPAEVACAG